LCSLEIKEEAMTDIQPAKEVQALSWGSRYAAAKAHDRLETIIEDDDFNCKF